MSTAQPPPHPAITRRGAGVAADGEFHMPTRVFFGRGVAGQAAQHAAAFAAKRIMLISDPGVADAGLLHSVRDDLASAGLRPLIFTSVEPNPRDIDCLAGTELARDAHVEALVAVGGGSSIDTAKCIALLLTNGGHPRRHPSEAQPGPKCFCPAATVS
jgi:alcohol dehydrogenase